MVVSDVLSALLHLSDHDYSWLAQFFSLLFLPFAHEDLAIILGGYIVVNNIMPVGLVALCIYGGMVASDFALYGIGAGARHLPWLTRLAVDDRVRTFADTLKRNLFGIVTLCRVVPGVVFIAFVACGWTRVPLGRFTLATLVTSALYLPLMLCIVVFFGDALDDRVGLWTWPFLLCVLVAIGFVRRQVFTFRQASNSADGGRATPSASASGGGVHAMPVLGGSARKLPVAERIPLGLFYLPLIVSWIGFAVRHRSLTLPTVANPYHPTRGMGAESKSGYLLDVAATERRWIADLVVATRSTGPRTLYADLEQARQSLYAAGLAFPLIAKPDIGRHGACRLDDMTQLREYLRHFPRGEKLILQRFVPHARAGHGALCAAAGNAERSRSLADVQRGWAPPRCAAPYHARARSAARRRRPQHAGVSLRLLRSALRLDRGTHAGREFLHRRHQRHRRRCRARGRFRIATGGKLSPYGRSATHHVSHR